MARLIALTLNPAVDITYRVAEQQIGETLRVEEVSREPGGKGINAARVLHQLGQDVIAIQPLGGHAGDWMRSEMQQRGVPAEHVQNNCLTRSTVTVVDTNHHPTVFAEPGGPLDPECWDSLCDRILEHSQPGGLLLLSGSMPRCTTTNHLRRLISAAHTSGARVVVDTSGPALLDAATAGADLLKPNEEELLQATGHTTREVAARSLLMRGVSTVVVSRGADGLWAAQSSQANDRDLSLIEQPAVPYIRGNPIGAGDAATAGLLAGLLSEGTISGALRWASVIGAAAVLMPTAGTIDVGSLPGLASRLPVEHRPIFPHTLVGG